MLTVKISITHKIEFYSWFSYAVSQMQLHKEMFVAETQCVFT